MSQRRKQTLQEGFEKFVIRQEGCWDWSGCCPNPGYPQFRSNMKIWRAHRASWTIHFGEIPEKKLVCHHCDNRKCSNPEHLFLGDDADNMRDMIKKGRSPTVGNKGNYNTCLKFSESQVFEIKKLLELSKGKSKSEIMKLGLSQKKIAEKFGVNQATISKINTNKYHDYVNGGSYFTS